MLYIKRIFKSSLMNYFTFRVNMILINSPGFFFRDPSACFPIEISERDPVFRNLKCMNMVRHAAVISLDCTNGMLHISDRINVKYVEICKEF